MTEKTKAIYEEHAKKAKTLAGNSSYSKVQFKHTCKICRKSMTLDMCLAHRYLTGHAVFEPYCALTVEMGATE